jgi:nucleotide-binding universal stress UspA family protein
MTRFYRLEHILVPVDGSEFSHYAAEHAVRIAQAHAADLIFLHVVDEQVVAELAQQVDDDCPLRARERLRENAAAYLHDCARVAEERHVSHREEVAEGDPATVVCETAARNDVHLIVMGKIGRRGARRILMGSITRRVAESTDRPLLIVTGPPAE